MAIYVNDTNLVLVIFLSFYQKASLGIIVCLNVKQTVSVTVITSDKMFVHNVVGEFVYCPRYCAYYNVNKF